jgi:hypothetical protein
MSTQMKHETPTDRLRNFSASLYKAGMRSDSDALNEIIRQAEIERDELLAALFGCVKIMQRAFSNGLPIQQCTLCDKQDWDASIRQAASAIAKAKGEA